MTKKKGNYFYLKNETDIQCTIFQLVVVLIKHNFNQNRNAFITWSNGAHSGCSYVSRYFLRTNLFNEKLVTFVERYKILELRPKLVESKPEKKVS